MVPVMYGPQELGVLIWRPWRFDRIEVFGQRFTGPPADPSHWGAFDRPSEPVSMSLPGEWFGQYESGPNLLELAGHVARILGPGSYGVKSLRRLGFRQES